ncbi:hypothetical protein JADG_010600 [Aureobasidium aubasidani]|nr:hypothetical protein JADG_010600 [Aureobasidium pullulans]
MSSATFTESVPTFESKNLVEFTCLSTMATGEMNSTKTCVVTKNSGSNSPSWALTSAALEYGLKNIYQYIWSGMYLAYAALHESMCTDLVRAGKEDIKWFESKACDMTKVYMEPGDFGIWEFRTMHYAKFPEGGQIRHVQ